MESWQQGRNQEDDGDATEDDEQLMESKIVHEMATFDEITVWGHETLPEAVDDPYSKGIDEWIKLAHAVSQRSLLRTNC